MARLFKASKLRDEGMTGRMLLFISFAVGASFAVAAVSKGRIAPLNEEAALWKAALLVLPSTAAMLISSSLFGLVLMPFCAFCYGHALSWLASSLWLLDASGLYYALPQLLALPAFFLVAAAGMDNSAVLCSAFFKSDARLKARWGRRFAIILMSVAVLTLCAYVLVWN